MIITLIEVCTLIRHCHCYHKMLQRQSIHLFHHHCQGSLYLPFFHFPGHLHLLHYPLYVIYFLSVPSYSLIKMIGVSFGSLLGLVLSASCGSKIITKRLMLVFHPCPFSYKSPYFSMMALNYFASVLWSGCWGGFIGRLALTCWWILDL